jgi:hypothetical protein
VPCVVTLTQKEFARPASSGEQNPNEDRANATACPSVSTSQLEAERGASWTTVPAQNYSPSGCLERRPRTIAHTLNGCTVAVLRCCVDRCRFRAARLHGTVRGGFLRGVDVIGILRALTPVARVSGAHVSLSSLARQGGWPPVETYAAPSAGDVHLPSRPPGTERCALGESAWRPSSSRPVLGRVGVSDLVRGGR